MNEPVPKLNDRELFASAKSVVRYHWSPRRVSVVVVPPLVYVVVSLIFAWYVSIEVAPTVTGSVPTTSMRKLPVMLG